MMRRTMLLGVCMMLPFMATLFGHELIPIGTIPHPGANWEVSADDQQAKPNSNLPFHWIVFRNKTSGDLLSFAARPPETGPKRGLEYWSDTALEIFPNGHPVWGQRGNESTTTVLNIKVVTLKRQDVLAYSFVSESAARENLMAHGCVWVCEKGVVFVQHTSTKPITPETVHETVSQLIRSQSVAAVQKSP